MFIWKKMDLIVPCVLYRSIVTFLRQLHPGIATPSSAARENFPFLVLPTGGKGESQVIFTSGKTPTLDLGKAEKGVGAGGNRTAQGRAKSRKNIGPWTEKFKCA